MPKQRGGWKGKPKGGKSGKAASDDDEDLVFDEIDRFHNKKAVSFDAGQADGDEDELDEAPVFNMKTADSDEDFDDDDDEEIDDDEEAADDDEDDDSSDEERRAAAISREEKMLSGWGKKKSAFYDNDAEVEIDDEAAAAEEQEAIRLQKKRAAALEEDDLDFGLAPSKGKKAALKNRDVADDDDGAIGKRLTGSSTLTGATATKSKAGARQDGVYKVKKDLSNLSDQQKLEIVMADTPELLGLLEDLKTQVSEIKNTLVPILSAVKEGKIKNTDGLSYLEAKQQILLTYITDITFYLLLKAEGKSVRDHPVITQLVHVRTLLERLRPLDAKMSNQIGRLLKAAKSSTGSSKVIESKEDTDGTDNDDDSEGTESEPEVAAKPKSKKKPSKQVDDDLEAAIAQLQGVDEEGYDAEITGGVFRPLRRAAVMYDDDPTSAKKARDAERRRKKVSESAMLADLRAKYSEAPEEEAADGGAGRLERNSKDVALERLAREREAYEEEAFTRVGMSKEEKKARKARERELSRWDNLADLEQFGDMEQVLADEDAATTKPRGRAMLDVEKKSRKSKARDADEDIDEEDDYGVPPAISGMKRRRGPEPASDGESSVEEDPFYAAVAAAAQKKKARRAEAYAGQERDTSEYIRSRPDEDELHDPEGHRRISKTIQQNRGLVKYRKKEDKNPRAHYRKKAEKAVKRRKGQVVPMRDSAQEAGKYGGESTGIRTTVTHSRKIRS